MMSFKGFEDWVPIFKGGIQTDSNGRQHDGDRLIDKAISNFNPDKHEPPLVVGHPRDNAPAYGWVEGLSRVGNTLFAKFKQVAPAFEDWVKKGLYKKRSASFYPDGSLRHVAFLGAAPPAVKGLPDISYSDADSCISFDFSEGTNMAGGTAGDKLDRLTIDLLNNPPSFNEQGLPMNKTITYSEAFSIIQQRYPELAAEYARTLTPRHKDWRIS